MFWLFAILGCYAQQDGYVTITSHGATIVELDSEAGSTSYAWIQVSPRAYYGMTSVNYPMGEFLYASGEFLATSRKQKFHFMCYD